MLLGMDFLHAYRLWLSQASGRVFVARGVIPAPGPATPGAITTAPVSGSVISPGG
jgi:hypothetical protein